MAFNPYLLVEHEYFTSALNKRYEALKAQGKDILKLVMGDPTEPTFEGVRSATIQALEARDFSQYPPNLGTNAYRQAVADWAQNEYGVDLDPIAHIISCNGSKEAIYHLPLLFDWSQGQSILMPSMSYPVYEESAKTMGIPIHKLPISEESNFFPKLELISEDLLKSCQLFWINSPHNPTTAIADKGYFEQLLALAEKYDFFVCSDECYNDLYYGDKPASCLEFSDSERWIVMRSLSKRSHMTGYRMGAIISRNRQVMTLLGKLRSPMGVGTPDFIQAGAIEAWKDTEHPRRFSANYQARRDALITALEAKGFKVFGAQAGFYIWFSHPQLKLSEDILQVFIEAGLLIVPGTAFGADGEGYARIIYCFKQDTCDEVVKRIGKIQLP